MDNLEIVLAALLAISELLSLVPSLKANGILQFVVNLLKQLKNKPK